MQEVFTNSGFRYKLTETNATFVNSTGIILDVLDISSNSTKMKSGTIDYWSYGLISFTSKNIYLLSFVIIIIAIFLTTSILRHRHQRNQEQRKEMDFLRYYYSVMPHSQIYGNLSKLFENDEKTTSKKKRKDSIHLEMETQQQSFASKIMHAMYKRYPYKPYVVKEMEDEMEDDGTEELEMETVFELNDDFAETISNPETKLPERKKDCAVV